MARVKSGTTAIQNSYYHAAKNHALGGVCYPKIMGKKNHNELCVLFKTHPRLPRIIKSRFPRDNSEYESYIARVEKSFADSISGSNRIFLSAEYFCDFNDDEIRRMQKKLHDLGSTDIKIAQALLALSFPYLTENKSYDISCQPSQIDIFLYRFNRSVDVWVSRCGGASLREECND